MPQNFDVLPYIVVFAVAILLYIYFTQSPDSSPEENNDQIVEGYNFNPQNEIIMYHASWCSACHEAMPEWDKFAQLTIPNLKITKS